MLEELDRPSRRHTFTVYILFGTIILVFIFWGFKTVDGPSAGYAASVNNEIISVGDFKRAFDRQYQFYSGMMGGKFDLTGERRTRLRAMVLDQLIGEKVMAQGAEKEGFMTPDVEIREQIVSIPAFSNNGAFQRDAYQSYIRNQMHISPAQFEAQLRQDASLGHVRSLVQQIMKPLNDQLVREFESQHTKFNLDFVAIDTSDASFQKAVGEKELKEFLAKPTTEGKLKAQYEQEKEKYSHPEEIRASHILIKVKPEDAASEAQALKKINEIAAKTKTEDFAKLASQYSEDTGSKAKKGDLGFFSHGRMVEAFEKVAFNMEVGKISAPVKTDFGYHIIKVTDKHKASTVSFDEAKQDLAKKVLAEERGSMAIEELDKSLKDPKGLDAYLSKAGLKWQNTGLFDASGSEIPKIGRVAEVVEVAETLSKEQPLANRVIRFGPKAYIVKLKGIEKPAKAPTDKELEDLASRIAMSRSSDILSQWQKDLMDKGRISRNSGLLEME